MQARVLTVEGDIERGRATAARLSKRLGRRRVADVAGTMTGRARTTFAAQEWARQP